MTFGEKVKELRVKAHLTQKEVAERIGVSTRAYQCWEQQNAQPKKRSVLLKLAELFSVSIDMLMSDEELFILDAAEKYGYRGKQQGQKLLNDMQAYLAGGDLNDEDRDEFLQSFMRMFFKTKEIAKTKYGRQK